MARRAEAPRNLPSLTGLRIVAALWVLLLHITPTLTQFLPAVQVVTPVLRRGGLGVELFFTLSGFVLAHQYVERFAGTLTGRRYVDFLRARLARIYPAHVVTLHLAVALYLGARAVGLRPSHPETLYTVGSYVQNLFLVQSWLDQPYSWNTVAWSVSAEWFAYLLFPVGAVLLFRAQRPITLMIGVAAATGVYVLVNAVSTGGAGVRPDLVLFRIAVCFTIGCLLNRLFNQGGRWDRAFVVATPVAAVAVIALCYVPGLNPGAFLIPFAILVLGLAHGASPVSTLLGLRFMVYGGEISYSLYLVHDLTIGVVMKVLGLDVVPGGLAPRIGSMVALVVVPIAAAVVLYHVVEKPARSLIRGRRPRRAAAQSDQ